MGNMDEDEKAVYEKKKAFIKKELAIYDEQYEEISKIQEIKECTIEEFLNLAKNACVLWKNASPEIKHKIAETIILNLIVKDGKVAEICYLEPFDEWQKRPVLQIGGGGGS